MNCSECRDRLDLCVLGALEAAEQQAVDRHVTDCEACRVELTARRCMMQDVTAALAAGADEERLARLQGRLDREIRLVRQQDRFRRVRAVAAAVAAGVVLVGVCGLLAARRRSPAAGVAAHSPTAAWRYDGVSLCEGLDCVYPLVRGETVLAFEGVGADRRIVALARRTGDPLWRTPFAAAVCSVSADRERLFTWRLQDGAPRTLVALAVSTGRVLWELTPPHSDAVAAGGALMVSGGVVCWGAGGQVMAVACETGEPVWTARIDTGRSLSAPTGDDESVYVASGTGLCALRTADGSVRWRAAYATEAGRFRAPLLRYDGERIVVAHRRLTGQGTLRCHDPGTGRVRWELDEEVPLHSVTLDGNVYVRSERVIALDGDTGQALWSAAIGGCSPLVLARDRLYAVEGRESPLLLALDRSTGRRTWEQALASSCSGLVVVGRMGYVSAHDGALYAVNVEQSG